MAVLFLLQDLPQGQAAPTHRVPLGHSRLDSRHATGVHESMDGLNGAAVVAHVLVCAVTSARTLAFQGPGQADGVPIVLGDDVQ